MDPMGIRRAAAMAPTFIAIPTAATTTATRKEIQRQDSETNHWHPTKNYTKRTSQKGWEGDFPSGFRRQVEN